MTEEIVTFKTAKLAKEKEFANKTPHKLRRDYYNHLGGLNGDVTEYVKAYVAKEKTEKYNTIDAPTQSLLQKWLREKHEIHIEIIPDESDPKSIWHTIVYPLFCLAEPSFEGAFVTYEEALEEGLQEALKFIEL